MQKSKIYFRADGNAEIGLGHVIRSLGLAEMLQEAFECHFIIQNPSPSLKQQIQERCHSIIELAETENYIEEATHLAQICLTGDEIVVLDGYQFKTVYQRTIKNKGCKLVCIDDIYSYHFVADAVINHAPGLNDTYYSLEPYTQLCLGLEYSLLRSPFLKAAQKKRTPSAIDKVFICFGGSDFNNVTFKILKLLSGKETFGFKEVNVILGSVNKYRSEIEVFVANSKALKINLHYDLSASKMCALMETCQLAIVPASSILYEIVSVKMIVISGYYVANQLNVYKGFRKLGLIHDVGDFNIFNDYKGIIEKVLNSNNKKMLDLQAQYQQGNSKRNFLRLFTKLSKQDGISYRRAKETDLLLYLKWANDQEVRRNAISTAPIPMESHKTWFQSKLGSVNSFMYIFEQKGIPFGQVRFDIETNTAAIDYSIDKNFRGQGLGKRMLQLGIEGFLKEKVTLFPNQIIGIVKIENIYSAKIFKKLAFVEEKIVRIKGNQCFLFSRATKNKK